MNHGGKSPLLNSRMGTYVADTVRLCNSIENMRFDVLGLNAEYTEIMRLPNKKEVALELEIFDERLRSCLENLFLLKDEYFYDRFENLTNYFGKCESVMQSTDMSANRNLYLQAVEYEDLWREFLGLYCSCLVMAAKICETKEGQEEVACALYSRIILLCTFSGAYANLDNRGRADGRFVEISRYRVRKAVLKFSLLQWQAAENLATSALLDFGAANLHYTDPDMQSAINILHFLNSQNFSKKSNK